MSVLDRRDFPVTARWAYLDHAGIAPLPQPAAAAAATTAEETAVAGRIAHDEHQRRIEEIRAAGADLMGVPVDDVAFVKNTTEGLAFAAAGLEWEPGDRVVLADREFPSTAYPWLALRDRGVEVDLVEPVGDGWCLPLERFAEVVADGPPPKVVTCSWVQFQRGWRTDLAGLADIAHDAGALLVIDAIQGLGVIPAELHTWGVDVAAADSHKWLLGPMGAGLLYVRGAVRDRLRPPEPGWASVAHRTEWDNLTVAFDDTARRFEGGSLNVIGIHAMGAALDLLQATGVGEVWAHVERLCEAACDLLPDGAVLSDRTAAGRSGILTVAADDPERACAALRDEGVVCSPRGGGVRLSPHGYNTLTEIETAVKLLSSLRR